MKLDLTKFDDYVNDKGLKPSDLLEDANSFTPVNLKGNNENQRSGPSGSTRGGQHFPNSSDEADVIAKKFMESTYKHIEDLSDNADKIDLQQKVDKLKEDMGTRLKHIFDLNEKDASICHDKIILHTGYRFPHESVSIPHSWVHCEVDEKVVAEISDEILGGKRWVENVGEKLRAQEKALAAEIRNLMNNCQDGLTTWATLTASLSRDWGADASVVAGLVLAMTSTANWMCSKFKGAGQVDAGPIAEQFLNDNGVEDVFEAFGVEE